jgi:hypothetical protein
MSQVTQLHIAKTRTIGGRESGMTGTKSGTQHERIDLV